MVMVAWHEHYSKRIRTAHRCWGNGYLHGAVIAISAGYTLCMAEWLSAKLYS